VKISLFYSELGSRDLTQMNFDNADDFAEFLIDTWGDIIIRSIEKVEGCAINETIEQPKNEKLDATPPERINDELTSSGNACRGGGQKSDRKILLQKKVSICPIET
jgi:hypothetical protein